MTIFNKYFFTFFLSLCIFHSTICQSSFSLLISTPEDERLSDATEDQNGNLFLVGRRYYLNTEYYAGYFIAVNSLGEIYQEIEFINGDTVSYFVKVFYKNDSIYLIGAKGTMSTNSIPNLWLLCFDQNFQIIIDKTFSIEGYNIGEIHYIINSAGNFVISSIILPSEPYNPDMLLYEITPAGDSIRKSIIALDFDQLAFDLIENREGGYKIFAVGQFPNAPPATGKIVHVDAFLNFLYADSIPYGIYANNSARWLTDTTYLVTGKKNIFEPEYRIDMGIVKLNTEDQVIQGNHFGKSGDTMSYVGACSNLDILSSNNIYFGGVTNFEASYFLFQTEPSWLMLTNLDSNLNLNWQQFYGGDAAYFLWGLKATQDGGCLLTATRYDHNVQDFELDIFILKVDSAGLLTSTGDGPNIPVQQLAIVPNPAWDIVSIRYPDIFGFDDKEISIYNSQGREILNISATNDLSETRVNIENLAAGLYFVVLKVEGEKEATGKMVKR